MEKWVRANYQPNLPLMPDTYVTASKAHITLSRTAAEEGMVLLKNESNLLPLPSGTRLWLFGKGTFDYVKGGSYAYCDADGNYYRSGFGLKY